MKIQRISAVAAAAALALSLTAIHTSAVEPINAKIGFTDVNWTYQDWESNVSVTGDGTYTITSTAVAGTEEVGVFVIDLEGMYASYPDAVATLDKIVIDGSEVSFDGAKILYGDIEEKGNFRIDVYNMYSATKDDPGFNSVTPITESLEVTFTVSGLGAAEEAAPAAEEAAPAEAEAAPAEAEAAPAEEVAPAETEAAPAETEAAPAPAAEDTSVPSTGNTPVTACAITMFLAATAAFAVRKTK
ncbi:MAG: hypothetical protein K6G68_01100 [Oscillospiraceae bacterium]|nr:hypothetical protein [Oscillospiraceae bacterium]